MRTKKILLAATGGILSSLAVACTDDADVPGVLGVPDAGRATSDAGLIGLPDVGAADGGEDGGDAGPMIVDAGIVIDDGGGPLGVDAGLVVDAGLILDAGELDGDVHD